MIAAVRWLFHEAHLVAEPSGAAAVAAALARGSTKDAVAVVSGGNVDPVAYASYIVAVSGFSRTSPVSDPASAGRQNPPRLLRSPSSTVVISPSSCFS